MSDGQHEGWHETRDRIDRTAESAVLPDLTTQLPKSSKGEKSRGRFDLKGEEIGKLVETKNRQYGDSFNRSYKVLEALYPDGVQPYQYKDMLAIIRIIDKLFRIAQRKEDGSDLGGESPYNDITGYGILGAVSDDERQN